MAPIVDCRLQYCSNDSSSDWTDIVDTTNNVTYGMTVPASLQLIDNRESKLVAL